MVNKDKEQVLEEYLQNKSEVSRRYHQEATEQQPAKHLDEAILAAANKAAASKPRVAGSPFASNWYVPVSLAAVLVLCVGLVFNIYQDSDQELLTIPSSAGKFDQLPVTSTDSNESASPSRSLEQDYKIEIDTLPEAEGAATTATAPMTEIESKSNTMDKVTPLLKESNVETRAARPEDIEMIWQQKKKQSEGIENTEKLAPNASGTVKGYRTLEKSEARKEDFLDAPVEATAADEAGFALEEQAEPEDLQISPRESVDSRLKRSGKSNYANMTPEQWLEHIKMLWKDNKKTETEVSLKRFLDTYPDYPHSKIKEVLQDEIDLSKYLQ